MTNVVSDDAVWKSVSEKSKSTGGKPQYFVDEVKDKWTKNNNLQFLIGLKMVTKWEYKSSRYPLKGTMEKKRDMGRNLKTLHIVTNLIDIIIIQKDNHNQASYLTRISAG